jgi:hypothetical protein
MVSLALRGLTKVIKPSGEVDATAAAAGVGAVATAEAHPLSMTIAAVHARLNTARNLDMMKVSD